MAALASLKILPSRPRVIARLPGLALWLRSDQGITLNGSRPTPTAWQLVTGEYLDHAPELPPERPADLEELAKLATELNDVHALTVELHRRVFGEQFAQAMGITENDHEQIPIARDNPRLSRY